MKVCLICTELFGQGLYGGFGRSTRFIGRHLARRQVDVTVVVPRRSRGSRSDYHLDGIRVLEFAPYSFLSSIRLYREADADVYHSQDTSLGTYLAMKAMPHRKHIVTFRDPLDSTDWKTERQYCGPQRFGWLKSRIYVDNFLVSRSIHRADRLFCAARFLIEKVMAKYQLRHTPHHLPTPVDIPPKVTKSPEPTVCFVGRWHRRKRFELFCDLAVRFPRVKFIAVGGTNEKAYTDEISTKYGTISNLELAGPINQFESERLADILGRSWILVNTAAREGLPVSFLEAAANRCAILSIVNPDDFASRFGFHAASGDLQAGLSSLLENDNWRAAGQRGYEFVQLNYATPIAIDAHMDAYAQVLK